jgi:general secretion pathway protein E
MILSTLHTNTAAGAITRLIDMEVEPFLLSSVLTGVLAQRLVRRLCLHCRQPFTPDETLRQSLGQPLGQLPRVDTAQLYRATGCVACHGTGYNGRIALFDFLPINDDIARLILKRADARQIEDCAKAAGHRSLIEEGYITAAQGLTSIEEVLRVAIGE